MRAALLALVLSQSAPVLSQSPPADPVPAIDAALADKQPAQAETLARAALASAETRDGADALTVANLSRLLGDSLFDQKRYAEAEPHYRRALAIRLAQLGESSADTGVSANDLAIVLRQQQKYAEAEPYYRQALAIRRSVLGDGDTRTARTAYFLARTLDDQGRTAEAAAAMDVALAIARQSYGPEDPTTASWLVDRAAMLHDAGDPAAESAYREAIALAERVLPVDDPALASARQGLGNWLLAADRAAEAVPLYRAALATREAIYGADDAATMRSAERLGRALWATDDVAGAEALFRRVLAYREATAGPDTAAAADMLRWIGRAEDARGALADAEITYKRVLAISEAVSGPVDPLTGFDLIALGQLYSAQQRFSESRPLIERAVRIFEAAQGDAAIAASARMALSMLAFETGRHDEAMALAETSLADMRAATGAQSVDVASVLSTLAGYAQESGDLDRAATYAQDAIATFDAVAPQSRDRLRALSLFGRIRQDQGQLAAAESVHRDALAQLTSRYGPDNAELEPALADLGATLFARGDYAGAVELFERAVTIVDTAASRDAATAFAARTGAIEDQTQARAGLYDRLIETYYRLAAADPSRAATAAARSFVLAQQVAATRAGQALSDMAARQASGTGALAQLVRQRQDLLGAWRQQDAKLTSLLGESTPDPRAVAGLHATLSSTDAAIAAIDTQLAGAYPRFAELQRPAPLSAETAGAQLGQNDVLLFFADARPKGGPSESFVWAVTPDGALTWQRLPRSGRDLTAGVTSLREALGVAASSRGPTAVARSTGKDRTGRVLTAAHALYEATLAPIEKVIAGRDLVIVPSRSLSALPFHLLLPALPAAEGDRFASAPWLLREHAIGMLPAVTALAAADVPVSSASGYVAFANPLLTGRSGTDQRAFARSGCAPSVQPTRSAAATLPPPSRLFRGASGDVAAVRTLPPLPETVDEVCAIADLLGASADALHLGAGATEGAVDALSTSGELATARILHFATHGLVSGDLDGLGEPALVMTPPAEAIASDDGLLTATEISALKLDADWVILSACNTASSDGSGESLSGLARAFFYAGARALLVSHWPVNSAAAVALASGAVSALAAQPALGKPGALRQAMLAEIAQGGTHADPVNWAPFIVVGTGRSLQGG